MNIINMDNVSKSGIKMESGKDYVVVSNGGSFLEVGQRVRALKSYNDLWIEVNPTGRIDLNDHRWAVEMIPGTNRILVNPDQLRPADTVVPGDEIVEMIDRAGDSRERSPMEKRLSTFADQLK